MADELLAILRRFSRDEIAIAVEEWTADDVANSKALAEQLQDAAGWLIDTREAWTP